MCTQVWKVDHSFVSRLPTFNRSIVVCEVLVEVMLSIAAARVVQVEFHSFKVVEMEKEGCLIAVFMRLLMYTTEIVHRVTCNSIEILELYHKT
jgi:hypothetical protein